MKRYLKNNKGLSLMELLITIAILGLLAVAFASIFIPSINISGKAAVINRKNATLAEDLERTMGKKTVATHPNITINTKDNTAMPTGEQLEITFTKPDGTVITTITPDKIPGKISDGADAETGVNLRTYVPAP